MFQYCETKELTENRVAHPVSYPKKHFSISKSFWSTIGFLYEMFRYCETSAERRNFSGESWYTSPSYARKFSILKICWHRKVFPYEMRRYCEPKTLTRILMPTPFLFLNVFRYRKFSETQKGSLTKSFGTVKQSSFTENPDTPTPLMQEKFLNQIFSETMKASLRNVSIQRDKKILGQSWCPPTFFSLTFFQKIISETQKGSSTKCFGTVRWNHFDAQSWRPPFFLSLLFFDLKRFGTQKGFLRKVSVLWDQKIDWESWCPPTFFSLTFSDLKKFLKHRWVHLRNVWVLWDKNFQRKIVKPLHLLCMKIFDWKTSETQKGSPTKFFGSESQKNWRGSWCPPPLFTPTFFKIKNFLKHRRVLYEMFRYCEANIFEAQSWSPDPFFLQHFLHLGKYLKQRGVPWRTLSVLWNKTVFRRFVIHLPFSCMKNFDARFFWSEEVFPNEMFQYCETKKLTENRDAQPVSYPKKHFSISKSFWSTIGFLYKMFRYCEVKPFRRTIVTTAPFLNLIIFRFQKDFEHRKVPRRKFSVLWDQKGRRRIVMCTRFLFLNIFLHKKFLKHRTVHLRNVWVLWDKNFQRKTWNPSPSYA